MTEDRRGAVRDDIFVYAANEYGTTPEYPWRYLPAYAVLRHPNGKWYGIVMNVPNVRLGLPGDDRTDILVAKCEPGLQSVLLSRKGFLPAYHLNKERWISVLLDGTAEKEQACGLLDMSYSITGERCSRAKNRDEPQTWLVPVNPKYYDIEKAFSKNDEIIWKQSNNITAGDTVYLYIAAPVSGIVYECAVLETDIPYHFDNGKVHMERVMKIRLKRKFSQPVPLEKLKGHGIFAVRGPIRMPYGLQYELEAKQ